MKTFDKNKMHYIPAIMQDWLSSILLETRAEVRENYALRFEAVREYCEYALEANVTRRQEALKNRK